MHSPLCQYPIHKAAAYPLCLSCMPEGLYDPIWYSRQELNLQKFRPSNGSVYQFRHGSMVGQMVGMVGFEPTAPCPQNKASRPLNYIPLVLLTGVEPVHRLFLKQPPLPVGLQEHRLGRKESNLQTSHSKCDGFACLPTSQ